MDFILPTNEVSGLAGAAQDEGLGVVVVVVEVGLDGSDEVGDGVEQTAA
jgi:hypothetical protein